MILATFLRIAVLGLGQSGAQAMALPAPLSVEGNRPVPVASQPVVQARAAGPGSADLERIALEHNPTLAEAEERLEQARGRAIQAGAYPNPLVVWTGSSWGNQSTAGTQEGFFQQPVVTGGKLRVNRSRYEVDVEMARWGIVEQQYRIRNGVRLRYLQVLAQQEILDLQLGLVGLAHEVVKTTREKVDSGHASEADLLMAENQAAERELDQAQLRERYVNTWRELAAFVGCPEMAPQRIRGRLEGPMPELSWEPLLARLLSESPEMRIAELQIRRQELTLKREQIEPIPDLVVRGGGAYLPTNNQTVGYSRVYVEFPIWDQNRGNIHTAEHGLLELRQDLVRVRLELQRRLSRTYNHYQTSEQNIRRYHDEILPRARRAFALYYRSFQDEDASFSRVQSSQSAYSDAYIKYMMQLLELRRSQVAIEGMLLVEETIEAGTLRPEGGEQMNPPGQGIGHQAAGGGAPAGRPSRVETP